MSIARAHGLEHKGGRRCRAAAAPDQSDPWLKHLDWTIEPIKYTKAKLKKDGSYAKGGEPRPVTNQRLPGFPAWYKGACGRQRACALTRPACAYERPDHSRSDRVPTPARSLPHDGAGAARYDANPHHAVPAQVAMERVHAAASGRQRLGLRGATVRHQCRSASIGGPLLTPAASQRARDRFPTYGRPKGRRAAQGH